MWFDLAPTRPGAVERVEVGPAVVIGDIHGRSDLLDRLLARLPADRPVFVTGDVGDRGPDTRGVVDRLLARGVRGVRGNHEEWVLAWLDGQFDDFALSRAMGGAATLASYGVTGRASGAIEAQANRVPEAHRAFFRGLPLVLDLHVAGVPYWLVHAGHPSTEDLRGVPLDEVVPHLARVRPASLLWAKNDPETMLPVGRTVIMGHLRVPEPIDTGEVLAIDTGAGTVPGAPLTAVLLPERRFVQVA